MFRSTRLASVRLTILLALAAWSGLAAAAGSFNGDFHFRWSTNPSNKHRIMVLLGDVSFKDAAGKVWRVPKGTQIDGASIPAALWSFAGSPFTGNYRRASVIHDHYCDTDAEPTSAVHRVFLAGMEADGVGLVERITKYGAVKAFGRSCGRPEGLIGGLVTTAGVDGFDASAELQTELQGIQDAQAREDLDDRIATVAALARVDKPATFAALAKFRRVPSRSNLRDLELAVMAEQPTADEMDGLGLLAIGTVPEGSLDLPTE